MLIFRMIAYHMAILMLLLGISNYLLLRKAQANPPNTIKFQHIGPEDGLVNNFIASMLRDSRGFLWLATFSGLNRFDGMEFVTYRHEPNNPNSLSSSDISTLAEDAQGNLWIGTSGNGVNYFDFSTEQFTRYLHDPDDPGSLSHNTVMALHIDRQNRLWVATLWGLNRLDPGSDAFVRYMHDPDNPDSIGNNALSDVCDDAAGDLWVSGFTHGLSRLDPATGRFRNYLHIPGNPNSPPNNNIPTVHCAPYDMIWFSTYNGLSRIDPITEQFRHYLHDPNDPNSVREGAVGSMITDSQGTMWLAMRTTGVSQFDPATGKFLHYPYNPNDSSSLSSNYPTHLQEDDSGILWVSSYNKLSYASLTPPRFVNYQYNPLLPTSLSYPTVANVVSDDDGILWLGILTGGLNRLDRASGEIKYYRHDPDNPNSVSHDHVRAVQLDDDGSLWLGTGDGLSHFDPITEKFTRYLVAPGNNITDIHDLDMDSQGRIWFTGPLMRGVHRFDPKLGESLTFLDPAMGESNKAVKSYYREPNNPDGLNTGIPQTIMVDSLNNVWVGSWDYGVSRLDTQTDRFTHYVADEQPGSISGNRVNMIYEAHDGVIWVATSNGLNRFDKTTEHFKAYQTIHGLPENDVVSITEDLQGNLWLGTTKGIAKFNPTTKKFRTFDQFDGLQGNSFYPRSVFLTSKGELLFGGRNGLSTFYPEKLYNNLIKPEVFITEFQLFNQPVTVGGNSPLQQAIGVTRKITLTHEQSVFSFKFAALNLLYPVKNRYAYKLHGFDQDWIYTSSRHRYATYTNLDPGKYVFQVKGSNNDGIWNEEGVSIELTILPPWWETVWFRAGIGIATMLLLVGSVRWRLHTMAIQRRLLEAEVKQRTQELSQSAKQLSRRTEELDRANQAISELNTQLRDENLRMSAELDVSKRMQQMLLPSPEELTKIEDLDIAVFTEPANEVGGDYYDILTRDGRVTVAIGDVTGHGLESGIMMILVQAGLHTLLAEGVHEPAHFIKTLNQVVFGNVKRMESDKNLTLMLLDYQAGRVRFSGQHEELLWVSKTGEVRRIDTLELGFMVGVSADIERFIDHYECELQPGEGIVLYTDGVTEAMVIDEQKEGEPYGIERLCAVISHHWQKPAELVQQAVIQDVICHLDGNKPQDDITLVVIKRHFPADRAPCGFKTDKPPMMAEFQQAN